jgi:hypothetical protein
VQQQQQLEQAIFSLRLTLLKFAENKRSQLSFLPGPVSSQENAALYALSVAATAMEVGSARMQLAMHHLDEACAAEDEAAAERRLRMWLALTARGMIGFGRQLAETPAAVLALHAQAAAGMQQPDKVLRVVGSALWDVTFFLQALQLPGGYADATAAQQQLLQQAQAALEKVDRAAELCSYVQQNSSSSSSSSSGPGVMESERAAAPPPAVLVEFGTALGRQLRELGAELWVEFVPMHCCGNPDCISLLHSSELRLVGGGCSSSSSSVSVGCTCGACGAIRWCSKKFKESHKKAHKGVCQRIKQCM